MSGLSLLGTSSYLYVQGPKWEYRNDADDPYTGFYIPTRVLSLLRPRKDLVVLPGNNVAVREFARFCIEILGLSDEQMLYTSGSSYQIQRDARKELTNAIRERTSSGNWTLVPYSVSYSINALARTLGLEVLGDAPKLVERVGTKAILHPNAIPELRPKELPLLSDFVSRVRVPKGYLATTIEEISVAQQRLKTDGRSKLMLKPALGSAGEGIKEITTDTDLSGYTFPLGPVLLEERLDVDVDRDGNILAPSIQYLNGVLGKPTDQIMHGMSHAGNRFPSYCNGSFQREFVSMAKRILAWAGPVGPGGFDVLSVNGKPVLVDINLGRWTGAHPVSFFQGLYAPGSCFTSWKIVPPADSSVWVLWNRLLRKKIALIPGETTEGVFPICYLPGMWALIAAFGKSPKRVAKLMQEAQSVM